MKTIIYHNQSCSKSCAVLEKMDELCSDFEIINYIDNSPNKQELTTLLALLKIPAEQLVRKNEAIYIENYSDKQLSDIEWIETMIKHPILIERPIVVHGNKAVIGRPIQRVIDLLS